MTLIQRIKQRYTDFIHEGAIRRVQDEIVRTELCVRPICDCYGNYLKVVELDRELACLIAKRSPQQLARMKGRGE